MRVVFHHRVQAEDGRAVHIRSLASAFEGLGHTVEEEALVEKTGQADPAKGETTSHDGDEGRALPWSLVGRAPGFLREVAEDADSVPAARRLRAAVVEARPDLIHERCAFGSAAGVKVARSEGIPLVLVGMGPIEEELRDRALRRGVGDRVHFAGTRPHHRIPAILPAFDVGLVPAISPYASPLKLHESMAARVVTVAPDQPNLREVRTGGQNCPLFPPGDGAALNRALGRLAADASLRETPGAAVEERDLTREGNARRVVSEIELIDK